MEKRPVETLVERIDAALARIDKALARNEQDAGALLARHDRLKHSVNAALQEIDALIAQQDRP